MADLLVVAKEQARSPESPTLEDIQSWPATVEVPRACKAFRISRSHGYELVRRGEFPARVIEVGHAKRVVTASILAALSEVAV